MAARLNASPAVQALVQFSLALNAPKAAGPPPAKTATGAGVKLPDRLREGVQALAGVRMDDVRVHYRAPQVAAARANAYTQGLHIYVSAGQERFLAHEAWHAAQQKQGRVRPTLRENGLLINADPTLEREATVMGARAAAYTPAAGAPAAAQAPGGGAAADHGDRRGAAGAKTTRRPTAGAASSQVIQRDIGADMGLPAMGAWAGPFYRGLDANNNAIRPPWVGHWANGGAAHAALGGQSRNHVISHHHMSESLTNLLNTIYLQRVAAPAVVPAGVAQLTAVSASLFPNAAVAGYAPMVLARTAIVNAIYAAVGAAGMGGAPAVADQAIMAAAATALESRLTSADENVRGGNANLNQRIGNNIDPDFAGLIQMPAFAAAMAAFLPAGIPVPAGWAAGGAGWGTVNAAGAAGAIGAGTRFYCMTPTHNRIVWNFGVAATPHMQTALTVVRNDDPANVVPGFRYHEPLSSSGALGLAAMAPAGSPVLVFDPAGVALPIRFG